ERSEREEDGRATWQPQGVGSEAYLNGTSQGPPVLSEVEGTPEDARKDGHIRGRSKSYMKYPGWTLCVQIQQAMSFTIRRTSAIPKPPDHTHITSFTSLQ
ncbi:MAG: hypothetical protein OEV09_01595, partial [Deltaproteobacteria bacterium]|nr:hypothetical protein [Deltaproteobacteria bacterium]